MAVHGEWAVKPSLRAVAQVDWINWKTAFADLPVHLTGGNNADINSLLKSSTLDDSIPLHWRDQYVVRLGLEKSWLENVKLRTGYARATNPVPASTLSPLTAAITRGIISAGAGYTRNRTRFDVAYSVAPSVGSRVGQSLLKSNEYSNSSVRVGTHALVLTAGYQF